jgi:hypothetical protein
MPLSIYNLDNIYPPTWGGDGKVPTAGAGLHADPQTNLRASLGQDPVNYFMLQRVEGDLFKRDLVLLQQIKALNDFLGSRTGINYGLPLTRIMPGHHAVLGHIKLPEAQAKRAYIIAAELRMLGTPSADVALQIFNLTGNAMLYSVTAAAFATQSHFRAAAITNRGEALPHTIDIEVRVNNANAAPQDVSASFVWQPSLAAA